LNAEIIRRLHDANIEAVLIDENEDKISHFLLEDMSYDVPVMIDNVLLAETLQYAGIKLPNCKAIVSLFSNEENNLRVSILTRFLNPKVRVMAKSTLKDITTSILDTDIAKAINPFEIFAKRVDISLESPHVLVLENWIYQNSDLMNKALFLPKGKYIVCGYGRFGKALQEKFEKHGLDYVFIDEKRLASREMIESGRFLRANPDDRETLITAGIEEAVGLIVGTKNDIDNLSIMITAKKLNPDVYMIARENTMQEVSIFQSADIDWVFMIEKILINKTSLALTEPMKHRFLKLILNKDEVWAETLVKLLRINIGANPIMMTLKINEEESYAIYNELLEGNEVPVDVLMHSLSNWKKNNQIVPLLIKRKNEEILLPRNRKLQIEDTILCACDSKGREEIELIASNVYELSYAMTGKEKESPILKKIFG
jgi:Trk K+ transport system NAD-binding subunit